jgi:hypothetical protein
LGTLLAVSKEVLEALRSLEGMLVPYAPPSFDGFSHLSGLGELDCSFFDSDVIVDKWWLHHIIEYAGSEPMKE